MAPILVAESYSALFFRDKDEQGMLTIIHYPHEKTHEQEC